MAVHLRSLAGIAGARESAYSCCFTLSLCDDGRELNEILATASCFDQVTEAVTEVAG